MNQSNCTNPKALAIELKWDALELQHTNMSLDIHYSKPLVRYNHSKTFLVGNKHRSVKTTCLKGFWRQVKAIFKLEDNIVISKKKKGDKPLLFIVHIIADHLYIYIYLRHFLLICLLVKRQQWSELHWSWLKQAEY